MPEIFNYLTRPSRYEQTHCINRLLNCSAHFSVLWKYVGQMKGKLMQLKKYMYTV